MQKKRSRKNGTALDGPAPAGRRVRVRRRLVVGVAVAGLTVLAAGAPAVVSASRELNDSQSLVTLAEQTRQTLTLAHLLGDERDAVAEYAAKGRPGSGRSAVDERTARTDRQLADVRAEADEETARALGRLQTVRDEAVGGKGGPLAAHQAYAALIAELLAPGDRLAELTPPRATDALATTRPLAPLGQAVEQASATRGLLVAALSVPVARGEQTSGSTAVTDELTAAAQRARVREQGALEDFARSARPDVRQTLAATVTGPEVKSADDYLKRLTDRPTLTTADRKTDAAAVGSALTARIDRMRSVESTLAGQRATALATLRDEDVTRLETVIALLGVLFLLTVGVSTAVARSLTRPLSVLRRGAARLATPEGSVEPVRFTGRNDEFAEVVRHLNAVRDQTVSLHTRIAGLDADRRRIIGRNEALTGSREVLEEELSKLRGGLEEHRRIMSTTSVSLSLRTLGLVERQLAVIEELESKEQDPDRLATLFKLDHLATVMRRHNENLLVLAGQEHGHGQGHPVPLVDVMRAAVSEIERYERVDLAALPSYTQVAGHAADDISHVLAELLENATTFSPPDVKVKVSGWLLDSGDAVLSVVDAGIGVTEDRLEALNARLSSPEAYDEEPEAEHGLGLGLYVAGRLAARHGVTAELRAPRDGGTEALVVVPAALLPATPPTSTVHTLGVPGAGAAALHLPGMIAEANGNTLPARTRGTVPPAPAEAPDGTAQTWAAADPAPADPVPAPAPAEPAVTAPSWAAADTAAEHTAAADDTASTEGTAAAGAGAADAGRADARPGATAAVLPLSARAAAAEPPAPVHGADPVRGSDTTFTVPAPAVAPAPELPARRAPAAPAEQLPPAEQVFTAGAGPEPVPAPAPAPEEQLLARLVPEAAPAAPDPGPAPDAPAHATAEAHRLPRQGGHPADPAAPGAAPAEPAGTVTDKGLPKRTPRTVSTGRPEEARPEPARRVDADELRRRLGGFYQGAQDGRRVVAAELGQDQDDTHGRGQGHTDQGDTAQEART
ncbi:nitrate- and nitrite sensing domain-containing protein [Streptomyces subrutilus]|uniref:sensor histidine kinase n=1 Tax=Streptomyces subrutilus TaxID=36818 RepID=UPI002E1429DC|nr:nitrate- and nitrite sensing domain-containing protein [Streptomyces subrutilus]